jgi:hypothetical protein
VHCAFISKTPPSAPVPPILPPHNGYLLLDKEKFPESFAGDVDSQTQSSWQLPVSWGLDALSGQIAQPAWKMKSSWYVHVADHHMIPIAAQRFMSERAGATKSQVPGSNAMYVSNPQAGGRAR